MSKLEKMKQFQAELDRRTQVEEQAWALIAECKFEEANKLLDSLDDEAFIEMLDWEEEETCHITPFAIFVVLILTQENIAIARERTTKKMKNSILKMIQIILFLSKEKSCSSGNATA